MMRLDRGKTPAHLALEAEAMAALIDRRLADDRSLLGQNAAKTLLHDLTRAGAAVFIEQSDGQTFCLAATCVRVTTQSDVALLRRWQQKAAAFIQTTR